MLAFIDPGEVVRMGTNPRERVKEVKGEDLGGRTIVLRYLMGQSQSCFVGLVPKAQWRKGRFYLIMWKNFLAL